MPEVEQRGTRRFPLQLPVTLRDPAAQAQEITAQTKDVSARGICFYVESNIVEGSDIEFTLTLPPEITLTESIRVRCQGRVVRVERQHPGPKLGVAATIDHYEFLAEQ